MSSRDGRRRPWSAVRCPGGAPRCVTSRQKSSAGPITRCGASSGPHAPRPTVRRNQLHPELLGGRRDLVDAVREVPRTHPTARCVRAVRRLPPHTERRGDVAAVRPCLHQPRGRHRGRTHRRPVPRQLGAGRNVSQDLREPRTALAPVGQQFPGRTLRLGLGTLVHEAVRVLPRLGELGGEGVLVGGRQQRGPVGPGEMADLVCDGPPSAGVATAHFSSGRSATSASSAAPSAHRSSTILFRSATYPSSNAEISITPR